jgi:hypothetical protein
LSEIQFAERKHKMSYQGTLLNDLLSMVEIHLQSMGRENHSTVGDYCPNSAAPNLQTSFADTEIEQARATVEPAPGVAALQISLKE